MSPTNPESRSSIDLGSSVSRESPLFKAKVTRNHPPRLQHSPSLPNIWFPPHSGPIPPQFEDLAREPLLRPSTPPSGADDGPAAVDKPAKSKKVLDHRESLSFDDLSLDQTKPLNIQRRRRINREHGHSLLTPPLTPSSSLKTATSVGSTGNTDGSSELKESYGDEADYLSTRFLLLSNVSKTVRADILRASIVGSLTSTHVDVPSVSNNLAVPSLTVQIGPLSDDSIKGVFLRCQQTNGIAMLAFFDVRHAEIAKQIISLPSAGPLSSCVGEDPVKGETTPWIRCQFITAEELIEAIGNSTFLASTDATFYLAVEPTRYDNERELRVVDDRSDENRNLDTNILEKKEDTDGGINLAMLKNFLKSFGGLRSFCLASDKLDMKQSPAKIFHVEYYDVREAISAYTAIDGQALFGMKLKVFGREHTADVQSYRHQPQKSHPMSSDTAIEAPKNYVPFPQSLATYPSDATTPIGLPGQYSHTRERFQYFEDNQPRPRSISAGQDALVNHLPRSPVPSPTYFYMSNPTELDASHSRQTVGYPAYNGPGHSYAAEESLESDHTRSGHFDTGNSNTGGNEIPWNESSSHHDSGIFGSHHDCYYCPSRGSPSEASSDFYASCSTPSPFYYPPDQLLQSPHMQFSPQTPTRGPGYEYPHYPTPISSTMNMNMANWAFEQAMLSAPGRLPVGDAWVPHGPVSPNGQVVPFCPPPLSMPGPSMPYWISANKHEALVQHEPSIHAAHATYSVSPPPNSHYVQTPRAMPSLRGISSGHGRDTSAVKENNQVNLVKIEDGVDTRTTVMIKNIPNKMNDRDLTEYIGKVCPRRIDFLYLRMDFQNGCNVGYAFVNFITVQDLLHFARKKLGEKWNMFSSEKVLQMSYANYQGKEALVEKFKNSCIMDEREAWRPKIFYSEPGPEQGLPELFPAPTHLRRKERSSFNRGALYVPGVGRGMPAQVIPHPRRQHQQDDQRRSPRHGDIPGQSVEQMDGSALYPPVGTPHRRSQPKLWGRAQNAD
ncbi:hypothetical protein Hypma_007836 [Hypsizygus marmoreus]|uniref:RRM domain-containing protein n=1 Tax=Hypsizygus marmoreus TaxID=39966 RepID=A0A369JWW2_HYPMA|nr:hypothetical protein Hypma_007836 [Hypsizygus marmoreus]